MAFRGTQKNLLFILLLGMQMAYGQVALKASISPTVIYQNEFATLRIEIENCNNIQQLKIPSFNGFNVVSGPAQETGMSNINGVSSTYMAISYVIQPGSAGSFNLQNVSALLCGKQYSSKAIKLTVKKGKGNSAPPNAANQQPFSIFDDIAPPTPRQDYDEQYLEPGETVADKVNKNMHVLLHTSKTSCYVGEPIVATYKLYSRLESQSKMTKAPSFNGFSVVDMMKPDEAEQKIETLNGREYNSFIVRKSQLYPLQAGSFEVEPATIDNLLRFIKKNASGKYGLDDVVEQTVSISSKPATVLVKPLPEQGKPQNFAGAVGQLEIDARLDRNNFTTDDAGRLIVTIGGNGNLHLLTAPDVKWPTGLDAFEPKIAEHIDASQVPEAGNKTFTFSFTVNNPGAYTLPPISFSFFNPKTAAYQTIHSKPIHFKVNKGSGKSSYDVDTLGQKRTISFSEKIFSNRSWIIAALVILLLAGLFTWRWIENKTKKKARPSMAIQPAEVLPPPAAAELQNPLAQSAECLYNPSCTEFYSLLNMELKTWLSVKFNLPIEDMSSKKIISALDNAGINNSCALDMQQLLQQIEWQLYTPFQTNQAKSDLYSRAQAAVQAIALHSRS